MWNNNAHICRPGTGWRGRAQGNFAVYLACVFVLLLGGCKPPPDAPKAYKGVLDLTSWSMEKNGIVKLDGEWEFYWNNLYTPDDIHTGSTLQPAFIKVPLFWNKQELNGKRLPKMGHATYRLRIKRQAGKKLLAIRVPDPNSAYRLWINGSIVASGGKVGKNAKEEDPKLLPMVRLFEAGEDIELVMQVSNYFIDQAGIWRSISVGTPDQVMHERGKFMVLNMALVGTFIILCIYNLFIFFLRRTEYTAILFSMVSLCFGLRTLSIDDRPMILLLPGMETGTLYRIQYESLLAACLFFCAFIYSLFPKEFSKKILIFLIACSIIEFIIVCCAPTYFYTSLLGVMQAKMFFECLYCAYVLVGSAIKKLRRALPLCVVMALMFAAGVNDTLYTSSKVDTGYMMHYAAFFILLVQAYIVATRISGAYFKFSNLTTQLNTVNVNLEQKVADRTQELESQKKKADDLLLNILPAETAYELKIHGRSDARAYRMATVMMIDMVGFTRISEEIGAELLVAEIDECFSEFDAIMEAHGIEKIKTIGDAYLCAGGLPEVNETHAEDVIRAAFKISDYMSRRVAEKEKRGEISFKVRIGINSGPVVAGIVGAKKFAYDIWGDAVKIAGEMEQRSEPGKINISGATYEIVKEKFNCTYRGAMGAPDHTQVSMYFVEELV